MKAAVCREFGKPLVIENANLAAAGPGEVRVQMKAAAICHSDILYADGSWGGELPAIFGHECAGVVDAVGSGVVNVKVGDHVVVTLIRSCGHCRACSRGNPVSCETIFALDVKTPLTDSNGMPIVQSLRTGGFAEYVVVHESQIVSIPTSVPFASASLLGCGVITGFGAVTNTAKVPPGSHVAVIGTGGVGLNAIQGARVSGAQTIIAIDIADNKLNAARSFGATHTVNSRTENVKNRVRELTGGRGADYVFVTVGVKSAFDQSYGLLATGGTAVLVGIPANGVMSEIDPGTMAVSSQNILGSKMGSSRIQVDIPNLIALYEQGRVKLDELVTKTYPIEEINEAIAAVKRGDALRNVIVF
jgi:Zn-dependent alcohol dehydrogenase